MGMNVPKDTLIVVTDGTKATMFRNTAESGIDIKCDEKMSAEILNFKGAAPLPTETSRTEKDEATFAKRIADHLYKEAHAGNYKDLVLIADPQTLGQIRPSLHKEVLASLVCELPKTLTNSTTEDIEAALRAA